MILTNHTMKAEAAERIMNSKGPLSVEITEDIRSIKANARYWARVVTAIQNKWSREGLNYTKEAIHEYLKLEKYGKRVDTINGKIVERSARSSKMTPKQFAKYAEWAEMFAIDVLNIDPAEIDGDHWNE